MTLQSNHNILYAKLAFWIEEVNRGTLRNPLRTISIHKKLKLRKKFIKWTTCLTSHFTPKISLFDETTFCSLKSSSPSNWQISETLVSNDVSCSCLLLFIIFNTKQLSYDISSIFFIKIVFLELMLPLHLSFSSIVLFWSRMRLFFNFLNLQLRSWGKCEFLLHLKHFNLNDLQENGSITQVRFL